MTFLSMCCNRNEVFVPVLSLQCLFALSFRNNLKTPNIIWNYLRSSLKYVIKVKILIDMIHGLFVVASIPV